MGRPAGSGILARCVVSVALVLAVLTVAGATAGCAKAKGSKEAFCKQLRETPALSTALAGYPSGDGDDVRRAAARGPGRLRRPAEGGPPLDPGGRRRRR